MTALPLDADMFVCVQVSEYLRKQMIEAEQGGAGDNEEMKKMLVDHDKLVEEIFQHEDKDKNGFISHDEFSGPKHDELWSLRAASPRLRAPRRRRRRVSRHHVFTSARNRLVESCPIREEHLWTRNPSQSCHIDRLIDRLSRGLCWNTNIRFFDASAARCTRIFQAWGRKKKEKRGRISSSLGNFSRERRTVASRRSKERRKASENSVSIGTP